MLSYRLVFSSVLTTLWAWKRNFSLLYIQGLFFHQDWRARYLICLTPTITFLCFYFTVTVSAAANDIGTDHPLSSPICFVTYHLLWLLEEIWPSFQTTIQKAPFLPGKPTIPSTMCVASAITITKKQTKRFLNGLKYFTLG